jgi:hypothetical protein
VKSDRRIGDKIGLTRYDKFDKFDKIKARMEELEMKRRDPFRDFVKKEGAEFLGAVKFFNASIEPHLVTNQNAA